MFREVARQKQVLTSEQIIEILKTEKRGVLSVQGDNGYPYGLPMNFWYNEENGYIYFHSGKKGHKTDAISADNKVSFCVYDEGYRKDGEWSLNISSVPRQIRVFCNFATSKNPETCRFASSGSLK